MKCDRCKKKFMPEDTIIQIREGSLGYGEFEPDSDLEYLCEECYNNDERN